MQFNSEADSQDLVSLMTDLTGTTVQQFPLKMKARFSNTSLRHIWGWIFDSYGGWHYDDSNQSNLPAAADTLTADQTSYALPTDSLAVRGIEVKDTGGNWHQLAAITEEQIRQSQPMGEFHKNSGTPRYYQLVGQSIRIFPPSNWTQAASLKVFFDRGSVAFASTDTTKTPGFAGEYHEAVAIGASLMWAKKKKDRDLIVTLRDDWQDFEQRIRQYYQKRFAQQFPPRIRVRDAAREFS